MTDTERCENGFSHAPHMWRDRVRRLHECPGKTREEVEKGIFKAAWRDKQGDVWVEGEDGLMHSPETAPFSREHVEKKWGPLVPIPATQEPNTPMTFPVDEWARLNKIPERNAMEASDPITYIECPVCHESMPAVIKVTIEGNDLAHEGGASLVCTPDMTDIHAHMWAHEQNKPLRERIEALRKQDPRPARGWDEGDWETQGFNSALDAVLELLPPEEPA